MSEIPNTIKTWEQYRISNYKNNNDLVIYGNNRFFIWKDKDWNDIKWNRSKTENWLTVLKYDNWNIESDWNFITWNSIDYLILKDILSTVKNNQEYWINKDWSILKWKQTFQKNEWPAWYFVSKWILHKNIKPSNLTYSTKFIYNENSWSFEETHEYLAWNYTIKEKYRNVA